MRRANGAEPQLNYRHAYHAGNFADVLKHAVLTRIVEHLKHKEKAFRAVDTHAGPGGYDLSSVEAQKTGEWRGGIGRVLHADLPLSSRALLQPYLDVIRAANPAGAAFRHYPGSPALVRALLRPQDRLTATELHPKDAASLRTRFAGDIQTRVIELDGWLALGAQLPPKEKRGLVLVDPPFEQEGEWRRLVDGLSRAHRRWPGGTYLLWYPQKDRTQVRLFQDALRGLGIPKMLDLSLMIRAPSSVPRLDGCGLIAVNPPYTLAEEMRTLMPVLCGLLADGPGGQSSVEWIAGDGPAP